MNSALRPNYRRAREIKADIDDIINDIESAEKEGAFSRVADLKDSLHELQHAMFLTGVSSEYDL